MFLISFQFGFRRQRDAKICLGLSVLLPLDVPQEHDVASEPEFGHLPEDRLPVIGMNDAETEERVFGQTRQRATWKKIEPFEAEVSNFFYNLFPNNTLISKRDGASRIFNH